jgi:CzcA family heavy metal efflux pump
MFATLIRWSIEHAKTVLILAGVLLAVCGWALNNLAVDVFPELNAPTVVVMTEAAGLAPDEVEAQVTVPMESALSGVPGLRRLRSSSAMGLSIVWAEFGWDEDVYRARQQISERLSAVRENLPPGTHAELAPISSITGEIMLLSISTVDGGADPQALRAFAEFDLRNRLLAVRGVSQIVALGGALPEFQVNVRQDMLRLHGLTMADVAAAAGKAHSTAAAGYLPNVEGKELAIRQSAQVQTADDIRRTIILWAEGRPITIGDVADVQLGPASARGTASEGAKPAVVLSVQKAPGVNTLALTTAIDEALDGVVVPEGMTLNRHVMRQSDFIQRSVDTLLHVLRDAVIIVAVVLILFLLDARTTIITLTALPLSLGLAFLAMYAFGLSINVMTLGGLAVALGGLVDDAVIDVENVFRRLKERRTSRDLAHVIPIVRDASNEIRGPMVFATIIIVLVFVPLLFLQGIEGRFFRPLGLTYIISTVSSLVVAVTVTPALCMLLLARKKKLAGAHEQDGFLVRWLKRGYRPTLAWAIRRRGLLLGGALVAAVLSMLVFRTFGSSFLPSFKEGTFTVFVLAPPGTSLEETDRLARGVEGNLTKIAGVQTVVRRTGRAERDEHAEPVSNSEIEVTVKPGADQMQVRDGIDAVLRDVPGITTNIGQPIEHRLSHILSGVPAAIAINLVGDDLERIRAAAKEVEVALKALPGTRDVAANREIQVESVPIRFRHADLSRAGLSPADAAEQVQRAIQGEEVAMVAQGVRRYAVMVRLDPDERRSVKHLEELVLVSPHGAQVRLHEVADVGLEMTPALIARENARRKGTVSLNVAEGANLGHLVAEVQRVVDPLAAKHGLTAQYGGQFEAQKEASRAIGTMGLAVLVVVFLLLMASTGSPFVAGLVLVNLPLALIGGIIAIFLAESHHPFTNLMALFGMGGPYQAPIVSIASLVGFITLFGIAVRNGLLLANQYQVRLDHGEDLEHAVIEGSVERLVPILMTALCAALGLLPLAWAWGEPGAELLAPLAVVVLGGLVTSTVLNCLVVPAGYILLFNRRRRSAAPATPSLNPEPNHGDTP